MRKISIPGVFIFLLILVTCFPNLFTKRDPLAIGVDDVLRSPSLEFPFGTDRLGRDIFARLIYGGQVSIGVAVGSVVIALLLGTLIGMSCGFFGKNIDLAKLWYRRSRDMNFAPAKNALARLGE